MVEDVIEDERCYLIAAMLVHENDHLWGSCHLNGIMLQRYL